MRILVHDYPGHPFQIQLSRWLAQKGHDVLHVYFQSIVAPRGNTKNDQKCLKIESLSIGETFHKYNFVKRWQQEIKYGKLLADRMAAFKPDIVISSNAPLDVQKILWAKCKKLDVPKIFWLQDIYSVAIDNVFAAKLFCLGKLIGKYYLHIEKQLITESNAVVAVTNDFLSILKQWDILSENVYVIPNWAPIDEIPIGNKFSKWSEVNSFDKSFVFLYSGTIGLKHNPELLVQLAQHFSSNQNVKIVVISEGLGADWLLKQKELLQLNNLILMQYQPFNLMPEILASAEVLVAILEQSASIYSVPSKVLTYLCAKKPILLSVSPSNLAAKIVSNNKAGYVCSSPDKFLQAAQKLYENSEIRLQMGNNGIAYAQAEFNINKIGNKFEAVINQCIQKNK